jgi:hypothetical protein
MVFVAVSRDSPVDVLNTGTTNGVQRGQGESVIGTGHKIPLQKSTKRMLSVAPPASYDGS